MALLPCLRNHRVQGVVRGNQLRGANEMIRSMGRRALAFAALSMASALIPTATARAEDKLLEEVVGFNGSILFLEAHVPALVIGVVRNGETAVVGFGEISDGSGKVPDGQTMMRVGSVTKAFTGQVLAGLVSQGTVKFTDKLQDRLGWSVKVPER